MSTANGPGGPSSEPQSALGRAGSVRPTAAPALRAVEPQAVYRPVSTLAVVSLTLGILSLLAFTHLYFLAIPLFALPLGGWTAYQLHRARGEYAGVMLAQTGVFLSTVALFGSVTKSTIEWVIVTREARQFSDQFLDQILAFNAKQAYLLKVSPVTRPADPTPAAVDELIVRNGTNYRGFLSDPLFATLAGKAAEAQVTYLGVGGFAYQSSFYEVGLAYRIDVDGQLYDVRLLAKGSSEVSPERRGRQWYIDEMQISRYQRPEQNAPS